MFCITNAQNNHKVNVMSSMHREDKPRPPTDGCIMTNSDPVLCQWRLSDDVVNRLKLTDIVALFTACFSLRGNKQHNITSANNAEY